MEQKKIDLIWLIASIGSFALMSVSFLLMPLDKTVEQYDAMDIIPGVMFWLFLILGVAGQIILTIRRKRFQARKGRVGQLAVFKNIVANIADVGLVISSVALAILTREIIMSVIFLLMPLDRTVEQYDALDIIVRVMIWLFLVLVVAGQMILKKRRKRFYKTDRRKGRVGLLSVFKNIPAIVADVGFVISLVALVIATKATNGMGYICYILLAVCVFTFCSHCIFNGKIYEYVTRLSEKEDA